MVLTNLMMLPFFLAKVFIKPNPRATRLAKGIPFFTLKTFCLWPNDHWLLDWSQYNWQTKAQPKSNWLPSRTDNTCVISWIKSLVLCNMGLITVFLL